MSFKAADDVRAAAAITPPVRMLVETDSPYLARPTPGQAQRARVRALVGAAVAGGAGRQRREIAALTPRNAARAFGVER